jgi:glycosylphosphatidylinositol transamidase (GPIT) subunit GPI8
MTGHGGDEFLKFHDKWELTAEEFGVAIKRYINLSFVNHFVLDEAKLRGASDLKD